MKRVLYLSYDGLTDPLGQSQVLPYVIGLTQKGYTFTVISFEKPDRYKKDKPHIQKLCNQHGIEWIPLNYTKKPPVLSTLYDLNRMKRLALKLHKRHNFQLTHCRSYLSAMIGLTLKRKGVKMLFDMRGFWADERIEGGIWNVKNPVFKGIYNFFKRKEKQFFQQADAIVSLTHAGKNELLSWKLTGVTENKITVIPCCVDLKLFDPNHIESQDRERHKRNHQLENHFVVGYVGSIGTWYMLKEMLLVFKQIRKQNPQAIFLFVTKENRRSIWKAAEKMHLNRNSIQIVSARHTDVPAYISLFDCSIFFIRPTYSKKASSPTKQGELMAMGIPLICNAGVGDTEMIVRKYKSGIVLDDVSKVALENFSLDLSTFDKSSTLNGAKEYFGLENGVASYTSIYRELI
jgi:glycosyltransferase involved in cell wall biosynthesis